MGCPVRCLGWVLSGLGIVWSMLGMVWICVRLYMSWAGHRLAGYGLALAVLVMGLIGHGLGFTWPGLDMAQAGRGME